MATRPRPAPARSVAVAVALAAAVLTLAIAAPATSGTEFDGTVSAEGDLMNFGPMRGPVAGLTVRVLEQPERTTTTDADGHWRIEGLPVGSRATFAVDSGGRFPIQTATFRIGTADLERVSFQSPTQEMVDLLADIVGQPTDPTRCQIASTVTRRGYSLYEGAADGTHGEPGATVTIDPPPVQGTGPIYFNGLSSDVIFPDAALDATTVDGGVLFVNVTPGTYTLRARKDGAVIREVEVGCRAGVLTNAAPPWGLQVLRGGLELDETEPFPTQTTTTTTTTVTPSEPSPPTTAVAAGSRPAAPARAVAGRAAYAG